MSRGRKWNEASLGICMAATALGVAWPTTARAADQPNTSSQSETTATAPAAPAAPAPAQAQDATPAAPPPITSANPAAPPIGMEEAAPVNTGHIHLELGADVTSEYWFRGIAQENQGLIFQPYADVTVGLINRGDFTVDAYMGTWNSLQGHTPNTGSERDINAWYESDFFVGAVIGLPYHLNLDVSYINLTSPANSIEFAQEIDVKALYDDSAFAKKHNLPFTLSPYALLAFEINGGSDAGGNHGTYLELGVSPSFALVHSRDYPVTLSFPMKVGLGLNDYYETADGDDGTFGFFDIGADLSMPLTFIPSSYGAWQAHLGVHYITLGDEAQEIGSTDFGVIPGDESDSVYATFGVSMTY